VRIYQYAGDERMVEAILPAILIMTLGLYRINDINTKFREKKLNSFR